MKSAGLLAGLASGLVLCGCTSSKSLYYWGHYEQNVYEMYIAPDSATAEAQVEEMEEDFERARAAGRPLPPGFQAHLGFLYFQLGKFDLARRSFESEKAAFPESAVLMDRFIKKLEG
jgi:hypothetical protein